MSVLSMTLKNLRDANGYSRKALADKIGVSETTVMLYETDYIIPDDKVLNSIAAVFDVSVEYLLGNTKMQAAEPISVNVVGSDGLWDGIMREREVLGKVLLQKPKKGSAQFRYFAIKVKGNKMNASRINKGDILIFYEQAIYENGDIVAVKMPDDRVHIRKYFRSGDIISLVTDCLSDNLPPVAFSIDDSNYKIVGKAIECRISLG
jgi:repressor LexA